MRWECTTRSALVQRFSTMSVSGIYFWACKSDGGPQKETSWPVSYFQIICHWSWSHLCTCSMPTLFLWHWSVSHCQTIKTSKHLLVHACLWRLRFFHTADTMCQNQPLKRMLHEKVNVSAMQQSLFFHCRRSLVKWRGGGAGGGLARIFRGTPICDALH